MKPWNKIWETSKNYTDDSLRERKAKQKLQIILDNLDVSKISRVADLGCGTAFVASAISDKLNIKVDGVDSSEFAINRARQLHSNCSFLINDVKNCGLESNQYDLVTLNNVIEHIDFEPQKVIIEASRLLRCGGHLLVISSNTKSFMRLERWGRNLINKWHWGYQKEYNIQSHKNILNISNLEIIKNGILIHGCDYKRWAILDAIASFVFPNFGRYIWTLARKTNE